MLDIASQVWRSIRPCGTARVYAGTGSGGAGNKVHLFGGQNLDFSVLADCEVYDVLLDVWMAGPSLTVPRRNLASTTLNDGRILALGGYDGESIVSVVEALDGRMKSWIQLPPLLTPRSSCGAGVLNDGRAFVCGGTTGTRLNSVEVYEPRVNKWEKFQLPMNEVRSAGAFVSNGQRIFALGGIDANHAISCSVEMMDEVSAHSWVFRQNMFAPRVDLAGCAVDDSIIVAGGQNAGEVFNTVELYDVVKDEWMHAPEMMFPRYGHSMINVSL